jgi:hypothetical protein
MTNASILDDLIADDTDKRRARTAAARAEWRRRLEQQVNPDGDLHPDVVAAKLKELRSKLAKEAARRSAEVRAAKALDRKSAAVDEEFDRIAHALALLVDP